jgi:hypothetical protein
VRRRAKQATDEQKRAESAALAANAAKAAASQSARLLELIAARGESAGAALSYAQALTGTVTCRRGALLRRRGAGDCSRRPGATLRRRGATLRRRGTILRRRGAVYDWRQRGAILDRRGSIGELRTTNCTEEATIAVSRRGAETASCGGCRRGFELSNACE